MKKVCIVSPMFLPVPPVRGGAIENLINIIIEENEKNKEFFLDIYTIHDKNIVNKYKQTNIIQIEINPLLFFIQRSINKLFHIFKINLYFDFHTFLYSKLNKKIKKQKYDKIVIENNMQIFKKIRKTNRKTPFIFHLHNDLNEKNKKIEDYRYICDNSEHVLVVSDFLRNRLNDIYSCNKVVTLNNVIDVKYYLDYNYTQSKLENMRNKFNVKSDNFIVGYVGRATEEKGLFQLISAFNKVKNSKLKLLLIIEDIRKIKYKTDYQQKVCEKILENNNNIIITDCIKYLDMPLYYKMIDLLVIPTICEEAFGLVALEAKVLNKKVIYTKSGALPEIFSDTDDIMINNDEKIVENIENAINKGIQWSKKDNVVIREDSFYNYYNEFIKYL